MNQSDNVLGKGDSSKMKLNPLNNHKEECADMSEPDSLRILHLEDDFNDRELVAHALEGDGLNCEFTVVTTGAQFKAALQGRVFDIILSDFSVPGFGGTAALRLVKEATPETPFIFVSGTIGEERAVESVKAGATDYVLKNSLMRLSSVVRRALRESHERQEREASEERFRQIAENIEEVFWLTDLSKGTVLYVSPAYERIWGRSCQSLYEDSGSWSDAIHKDDRERVRNAAHSGQPNGSYNENYRIVRPDGGIRWVNDRAFPIVDRSGNTYRIAGVASDITEKKELEAQFLRAQRMESIGTLAGGIAHDLNNALAPVLMAGEMLRQKLPDSESQTILEMILNGAKRGAEMVRHVLTFSRGLGGKHVAINAKHLIGEIEGIIRQTFPKNIRIRTDCAGDLWQPVGDATQFHQVLLNLCVNARDAMPHGGLLTVKASNFFIDEHFASMSAEVKTGPYILFSITDTGTGMSAEVRQRIFDPFFTTKPIDQGTGLGLSTVRGIVESHGGFISVNSKVGEGSEFKVFLPAQCRCDSESAPQPSELPLGKGERILVVDDEDAIRALTQRTLEAFNYKVLTASNGAEAMAVCAREKIELMLTDLAMPIMDGTTLIAAARTIIPNLTVITTSGFGEHSQQNEIGKSSAFMQKPFTAADLLKTIRWVIDAGPMKLY